MAASRWNDVRNGLTMHINFCVGGFQLGAEEVDLRDEASTARMGAPQDHR
jgi:hypothetical protein